MATAPTKISPHKHLPLKKQKEWEARYDAALKQAVIDNPDNPVAQRTAALKSANALLSVPAPSSLKDVEKLEPWQILNDQTVTVKGESVRVIVTSDGRKYQFPAAEEETKKPVKEEKK